MMKLACTLALTAFAPAVLAQCPIPGTGTSLNQNGVLVDGWTGSVPIGFAFSFAGTTYTDMFLSDHGLCALHNGGTPAAPPAGAFTYNPATNNLVSAPGPLLSPYWSDHSMFYFTAGGNAGELWVDNTSGTYCTVTWKDVETYIDGTPFTFQMSLFNNGQVQFCYDNRVCNEGSTFGALNAIVGMAPNGVALPAASDLSMGPVVATNAIFQEFTTTAPLTCNPLFDLQDTVLTFVPTSPGWVVIVGSLPCASAVAYGTGCGTPALTLAATNPVLGANWDFTTSNIDPLSPIAITLFGNLQVTIPLAVLGAPGCNAHIDTILADLTGVSIGGTSVAGFPLPLNATLKGAQLTAQSICLTTSNTFGLLTSNGVLGTAGY